MEMEDEGGRAMGLEQRVLVWRADDVRTLELGGCRLHHARVAACRSERARCKTGYEEFVGAIRLGEEIRFDEAASDQALTLYSRVRFRVVVGHTV
jgi:hypothetical protein